MQNRYKHRVSVGKLAHGYLVKMRGKKPKVLEKWTTYNPEKLFISSAFPQQNTNSSYKKGSRNILKWKVITNKENKKKKI